MYELTERGRELEPVILELGRFGSVAPFPDGDATFGPDALAIALKTLYEPGGAGASIALRLGGQDVPGRATTARRSSSSAASAEDPDATIEAEPGPLAAVLWHGRDLADAERAGAVAITGSRRAATRFLRRFPLPSGRRRPGRDHGARCSASSPTQPSSAEPRVRIHGSPRKLRPGTEVTPRSCTTAPRSSNTGASIQPWSSSNPVAQITAAARPAAVLEGDRGARRGDRARVQLDAEPARAARAGADERLALAHAPADPRARRHAHEPERDQPVEQVAPEHPLRQRRLAGADREVHLARRGELLRDLEAGVAAADHEHRPVGQVGRAAVGARVQRPHLGREAARERTGTRGTWNGPVATTTCRASTTRSASSSRKPSPSRRSARTRLPYSTGSSAA